ncbi:DUF5827 family protein [Halobaculum marinum]|uniref:DUF5827 family protein n=1 Tax=Halobaculum marinum TaxID=3031996 RepID=A0ABD5WYJ7_9EURY|nr:DUF5827 family protein [Halobaculum sp. DT55]
MPIEKDEFSALYPCDFYTPEELFEPDQMYTVYEIARLLQGLEPDAEIDEGTEEILLDWAIPWVMTNAEDLVVAEPRTDDEPGYYGVERDGDLSSNADDADE